MSVLIYLVIAVVVGGGASVAAESSLPGDFLYTIKTRVNEKVMAALATTTEAKANFEAGLAENRLEEMERLSAKGKVDANVASDLQARFQAAADEAESKMGELHGSAALEASSSFESSLRSHAEIFTRLRASESDDANVLASLTAKINNEVSDALRVKVRAEGEVSADTGTDIQAAAEGKMKAAENKIAEVKAFIAAKKASLGANATAKAEADINTALSIFAQGKAKLEAKAYGDAFVLFQQALQEAQEAELLVELNAQIDLNLQLKTTTSTGTNVQSDTNAETQAENGGTKVEGSVDVKVGL